MSHGQEVCTGALLVFVDQNCPSMAAPPDALG